MFWNKWQENFAVFVIFGESGQLFYRNPYYSRIPWRNPTKIQYTAVVGITIEKLPRFTKNHQNGKNFLSFIPKNYEYIFFIITNLNHPKNNTFPFDTHTTRVPPSAPALAEPTYPGLRIPEPLRDQSYL